MSPVPTSISWLTCDLTLPVWRLVVSTPCSCVVVSQSLAVTGQVSGSGMVPLPVGDGATGFVEVICAWAAQSETDSTANATLGFMG